MHAGQVWTERYQVDVRLRTVLTLLVRMSHIKCFMMLMAYKVRQEVRRGLVSTRFDSFGKVWGFFKRLLHGSFWLTQKKGKEGNPEQGQSRTKMYNQLK